MCTLFRRFPQDAKSNVHISEVVLAVLLPAFAFELTDKPIVWNSSAVMYPTMGEESTRPEMLLKVKALVSST